MVKYNEATTGRNYVAISADGKLSVGEVISITIKNSTDKKNEHVGQFTVTLENGNETMNEAVSFESYVASDANTTVKNTGTETAPVYTITAVDSTNVFKVKAVILNKYGEPVGDDYKKINFKSSDENVIASNLSQNAYEDVTMQIKGAGTATLTAYIQNRTGAYATMTIKVNPAPLTSISMKTPTKIENGKVVYQEITSAPANNVTGLKASDYKVNVTKGADLVSLELVDGDDKKHDDVTLTKNKTYVKITPVKNGKENIIEYTVSSGTITSAAKKFTTKVDLTATKIDVVPFAENVLKAVAGKTAKTTFTISNAQDEDITEALMMTKGNVYTSKADNSFVAADASWDSEKKVAELKVTCESGVKKDAVTYVYVQIKNGMGSAPVVVKAVEDAAVKAIRFDNTSVTTVNKDTHDMTDATRTSNKVNDKYYTLVKPEVTDSYGSVVELTVAEWTAKTNYSTVVTELAAKGVELVPLHFDPNGPVDSFGTQIKYTVAASDKTVQYFGAIGDVDENNEDELKLLEKGAKATFTDVLPAGSEEGAKPNKLASFTTVVKAARKVVSVAPSNSSLVVTPNGKASIYMGAKDQYGCDLTDKEMAILIGSSSNELIATVEHNMGYCPKFEVLGGEKEGSATITIFADNNGNTVKDATEPSCDIAVTAKNAIDLTTIAISDTVKTAKDYDSSKYVVKGDSKADTTYTFTATGKVDGVDAAIDSAKAVVWTIKKDSVALKNSDNKTYAGGVTINKNVVTVAKDGDGIYTGTITVTAKSLVDSSVVAEKTVKISSAAPVAQAGTFYASDSSTGKDEDDWRKPLKPITALNYEKDKGYTKDFYIFAIDQYGEVIKAEVQGVRSKDSKKVDATVEGHVVTTSAVAKDASADVVVSIANEPSIVVTVNTKNINVPVAQTGKYFLSTKDDITEVDAKNDSVKSLDVTKRQEVYVYALDQYGKVIVPTGTRVDYKNSADRSKLDLVADGNKIKLAAMDDDSQITLVIYNNDGDSEVEFDVQNKMSVAKKIALNENNCSIVNWWNISGPDPAGTGQSVSFKDGNVTFVTGKTWNNKLKITPTFAEGDSCKEYASIKVTIKGSVSVGGQYNPFKVAFKGGNGSPIVASYDNANATDCTAGKTITMDFDWSEVADEDVSDTFFVLQFDGINDMKFLI